MFMAAPTAITRRVLVVCRDVDVARVIEEATQPWMFETEVRSSLRESRDLVEKRDFALIFCEECCEDGTYQDLLSTGRSRKVPVVVMISDADQDFVFREAMALGAFGVVARPCSRKDVQWMVIRATQKEFPSRTSHMMR